jgi:uncharacterized protein YacL
LMDTRIAPLIRMGFLTGSLLVTRSVVGELQRVADSSDAARRARGRKSLDLLVALRRDPGVDVVLVDDDDRAEASDDVDAQLVRLARSRDAVLLTNDSNLARVAKALDVPVRSIDALAEALRAPVLAGEHVDVRLIRAGKDAGQAVGYLDDGTMVVVEDAVASVGRTEGVQVTNVLQTTNGRLVFARLAGSGDPGRTEAVRLFDDGPRVVPPGAGTGH